MSRPRLALLDASHGEEHTRRNFRRELDADLARFDVTASDLPPAADAFDGVVVTGSRASVYWDEPWIEATEAWTRTAIDRGLPVLGVCWGHQLLAHALGGEVAAMDAYELGYVEVERVGDSELLAGLDASFTAFATHSDEVVDLPPGASVVAETERSIHGFRAGNAYGVQFHPEYDVATARSVTEGKRDGDADPDVVDAALESIDESSYAAACETKRLFDNFLAIVASRRSRATATDD